MKNTLRNDDGYSVYPGTYVPFLEDEEVEEVLNRPHKNEIVLPLVNVTELTNEFKVEVAIPGVNREDFFVHADKNILSVCVIHKDEDLLGTVKYDKNDYECFDRHIILPENADAEFISAEYKDGILCLHTPKSKRPNHNLHSTIVVY